MCNTLASFFAASYSMDVNVDNLINMNLSNKDDVLHTLCSICFAESQVLHRLESLDSSKGGADDTFCFFVNCAYFKYVKSFCGHISFTLEIRPYRTSA